jgi:hypothetical protein
MDRPATPRGSSTALNVSATLVRASARDEQTLQTVLDYACQRRVAVVAAAGNASAIGGSVITRHPWVIPVVAYGLRGRALTSSNLGAVIGRHGLGASGENITSLRASVGTATIEWHECRRPVHHGDLRAAAVSVARCNCVTLPCGGPPPY